jgi:3D (Asp-Asp-Asp) domain-containing protein
MDWGNAIVIDPGAWQQLQRDNARLRATTQWLRVLLYVIAAICILSALHAYFTARQDAATSSELAQCHETVSRSTAGLSALARSQHSILAATEQAPSVGTKSWGRRFTVTQYLPRDPKYGKFNNGITSTLWKADPKARIVAVDPALIPYGSWVWVEGLGWFQAQDCGSAIKGFRLDVLTATESEAMAFGKQERFTIVIPPTTS